MEVLSSKDSKGKCCIALCSISQSLSETLDTNCQGCGFILLSLLVPGLCDVPSLAAVFDGSRICPVVFKSFIWPLLVGFSVLPLHFFFFFFPLVNR